MAATSSESSSRRTNRRSSLKRLGAGWDLPFVRAAFVQVADVLDQVFVDVERPDGRGRRERSVDVECEDRIERVVVDAEFFLVGLSGPHLGAGGLLGEVVLDAEVFRQLTDLLFVQVRDGVTVHRAVAVLREVAHERLAAIPRPQHEGLPTVRREVVEDGPRPHAKVPHGGLEGVAARVRVRVDARDGRQHGVDDGFDLDDVVGDAERFGDAFGVAHVPVAVDFAREHESVDAVGSKCFDGQIRSGRAVDAPRESENGLLDARGVELVADERDDVFAMAFQFSRRQREVEWLASALDRTRFRHADGYVREGLYAFHPGDYANIIAQSPQESEGRPLTGKNGGRSETHYRRSPS